MLQLLRKLGFAISWSKVQGPTKRICFLGITLDSAEMEASLTEDKLCKLLTTVRSFQARHKARRKELERLAGFLNHACSVVKGGRTFLRRVLDTMNSSRASHHYVRLTSDFQKDIDWWIRFVEWFNGKAKLIDPKPVELASFQTDASFSGFGGYFMGDYLWHLVSRYNSSCARSCFLTSPSAMLCAWPVFGQHQLSRVACCGLCSETLGCLV